jgi:NADH-quinone oxidoreductase subunit A
VLEQLLPIMILFIIVVGFGFTMIALAMFLGRKMNQPNPIKNLPYECGLVGESPEKTQTPVKFYLTAISFILFDIEIVFLYPFAITFVETIKTVGPALVLSVGIFVLVLVFGLFYEWKSGALEWD